MVRDNRPTHVRYVRYSCGRCGALFQLPASIRCEMKPEKNVCGDCKHDLARSRRERLGLTVAPLLPEDKITPELVFKALRSMCRFRIGDSLLCDRIRSTEPPPCDVDTCTLIRSIMPRSL